MVLIFFPIAVCKYVSSHDDSFCKVLCSRLRGFCKWFGNYICDYYYPMAVIEEEIDYVGEIDVVARASENKKFNEEESITDFIEARKKKFNAF